MIVRFCRAERSSAAPPPKRPRRRAFRPELFHRRDQGSGLKALLHKAPSPEKLQRSCAPLYNNTHVVWCSALALLASLLFGCDDDIRGSSEPSRDGSTALIVDDDNGGRCGSILVDGKRWPHPIGSPGPIAPGRHTIACGMVTPDDLAVDIPAGQIYTFDYWGP